MRVENFLRYSARRWGDKLALVTRDMSLSFTDLDALSDHLAADLQIRGLRPGDRTMIFMDNCWEAVVAIFAVLKAGGVFSPVNPSTKADKLAFMLRNCRARAVITQARLAGVLEQALAEETNVEVAIISGDPGSLLPGASRFSDGIAGLARPVGHVGIDMDLAMLIYTSGSTGRPKGVMMTHRNIEAAATSITAYLRNTADDVILNVLPIAFDYGLYQILMAIKVGATIVLEKSFAFPQAIFDIMRREKVTGIPTGSNHGRVDSEHAGYGSRFSAGSSLYHQHCCCASARAHRASAGAVSGCDDIFDVRFDRMQALHLAAAVAT